MMALRAHVRGGPEQLRYEQAPVPGTGPREALIAVHAAAITFAQLSWDLSWTTRDGQDRTPVIPSHEVSGTVVALGDDVTGLGIGDDVFGLIDFDRNGAAAEFVTVPASALAGKPRTESHEAAAALPLAALTAWQALVDHARLRPGEDVIVHGGGGGVGVYAVQLAAALGAYVTATGTRQDADFVGLLRARRFVSSDEAGSTLPDAAADVVIDTVGGAVLADSYRQLRPGWRLITLGAAPDQDLAARHDVQASFFVVARDQAELARLTRMVDEGRLRAVVAETFPLSDGQRAYASGTGPRPPGKTVLVVRKDRRPRCEQGHPPMRPSGT
jgi:NADPH:quinone reductase-like Zn-dependent oxidoreductase